MFLNNAPSAHIIFQEFEAKKVILILQLSYARYVVPCGIFPKIEKSIKGLYFMSSESVKQELVSDLETVPKSTFSKIFKNQNKKLVQLCYI